MVNRAALVALLLVAGLLLNDALGQGSPYPAFFNNNSGGNAGPYAGGAYPNPEEPGNRYCTQVPDNPLVGWLGGVAPYPTGGGPGYPLCAAGDQNPANQVRADWRCGADGTEGNVQLVDGVLRCGSEHGITIPDKALGAGPCCSNPIEISTGNKRQMESADYQGSGPFPLVLRRNYNSAGIQDANLGRKWRHSYDRRVTYTPPFSSFGALARTVREDGRVLNLWQRFSTGVFTPDADVFDRLTRLTDGSGNTTGWIYVVGDQEDVETYDPSGRLVSMAQRSGLTQTLTYSDGTANPPNGGVIEGTSTPLPAGLLIRVSDAFGRSLTFGYNASSLMVRMTDPAGGNFLYQYDGAKNLTSVTYPGGHTRTYHYNEPAHAPDALLANALTGITDENSVRFASYSYDASGRAIRSEHAGGVDRHDLVFNADGSVSVTDPLSVQRTYGFQGKLGVPRNSAISGPDCPTCGPNAQTFDANGNATSRTDWNGNRTNYSYDLARNLETSRTEGLTSGGGTTPQTRTISTQWHGTFRLSMGVAEPLRITTNAYDADGTQCGARGALCSRTIQATTDANGSQGFSATSTGSPRTWTYTYNGNGQVLTVNGPRTDVADVTTYTYDTQGNLATVTNAAGHVTSFPSYNAHGQPLTIIDPNGVTTTLTYDARQRLTSRTYGGETTGYEYDGVGQLTKVTMPDGSFLSYSYDAAHRLTGLQDNQGNRVAYTLDLRGNRTQEQVFDPANQLAQTRSRVYSNLNRLFQDLGAQSQTTEYAYDNQGNVTSVKDPLNRVTSNQYDALNRLRQVTDPASGVTQYGYNGLDALVQVTDPRSLTTGYTVDGLGNLTVQASPDTGNTTSTHDASGNLVTQTDAKGQTTTYAYDALNRVTLITFHDGSKQAYAYDVATNGVGRLSTITELDPGNQQTSLIAYAYEAHGRVLSETRTVNGIAYVLGYSYDSAGRLSGLAYPSGRTLAYSFDTLGRISAISTTQSGNTQEVVSNVTYHPFGGVKGYTLGNGQVYSRGYDQDGRINTYTLGSQNFSIGYDAASRIEFISEFGVPANSNTYGYDSLDRLTSAVIPGTSYGYSYDAVGNRLSKTAGAGAETLTYSSTSNRIDTLTPASGPPRSFVFDANGSTTNDGNNSFAYDTRGRMVQAMSSIGATSYQVNALGQRIRKSNSLGETVFHYDTYGKLIAETSPTGTLKRELIYLGDIPVGVVQ